MIFLRALGVLAAGLVGHVADVADRRAAAHRQAAERYGRVALEVRGLSRAINTTADEASGAGDDEEELDPFEELRQADEKDEAEDVTDRVVSYTPPPPPAASVAAPDAAPSPAVAAARAARERIDAAATQARDEETPSHKAHREAAAKPRKKR